MLPKLPALLNCLRFLSLKVSFGLAFLLLAGVGAARAQTRPQTAARPLPVPDRLVKPIDESARVVLGNTVHPLANRENDRGAVSDGLKLDRLQIVLKRSDSQETDLKQLIADMHTLGNASYHKWLTPEDFGRRFGPSDADVAKLTGWLQSHGFSVTKLNPGRQTLEFAGSAGNFRDAFKAQIHSFQVKGEDGIETRYANAVDPQIPAALAPVFGGFASLNNFRFKRNSRQLGTAAYNPATHATRPNWTTGTANAFNLVLAPADFAMQYSMPSQTTPGTNDGTGQSIAIVNDANINISVVNRFRTLFGLPANPPQVIIDGNDPGVDGNNDPTGPHILDTGEAYLDVEWAGATAPGATINLVIAADTALENGLALAAERAVYSNISPVISLSFGNCEADLGSGNAFFSGLWEQAAAQGITVVVSTGDAGSAACDGSNQAYAVEGQAVSGIASTPYNVAVGGTDFYYANGSSDLLTYWNLANISNATPSESLKQRIPEQPWNDSQYGTADLLNYFQLSGDTTIAAGSGGPSTLGFGTTTNNTTTYGPYPKPAWQKGYGDAVRDIPDLSLFASDGSNGSFYPICQKDGDCQPVATGDYVQISGVGGTSASTPSFAGIMALVNQQYGRQGQAGFVLYPLAAQYPAAFNDVTFGTNTVPCALGSPDCQTVTDSLTAADGTSEGEIGLSAGSAAYNAGTGYDLATGLGSVNVSTLLADWNKVTFAATTMTLTPSPTTFAHGTSITVSGSVTGTGTPTGDVALMTDSTTELQGGQTFFTLSGGAYKNTVNFLPGGTYNIWGNYGGDSANAPSSSIANKVQITVSPEPSTTSLYLFSGADSSGNPYTAPASVLYGTQVLLSAEPAPSSGAASDSIPTGNVIFTDGAAALNTAVLNAEGDAEFYSAFAPGSHTIKATYSGDASYGGSTSSTVALMVTPDTPAFLQATISNLNSNGTALLPGQQALIIAVANADTSGNPAQSANAVAPAGTLTLAAGPAGITTSATLVPAVDPSTQAAEGVGTFIVPSSASGEYSLVLTYTPSNTTYYNGITGTLVATFSPASSGQLASTTTATATPSAATPSGAVQVTTTISGPSGGPAPSGTISFYTAGTVTYGSFALPTGSGNATTATILFDSAGLIVGTNQITVQYSGDENYQPSTAVVTVSSPMSDFQMVPLTTIVNVGSSGTATDTINLASTNSFAGAVTFTCSGAGGVTCLLSPASATLAAGGSGSVTLTVNSAAVTKIGTYNVVVTGSDATGNYVHTLGFQVVVPQVSTAATFTLTGLMNEATMAGGATTSTVTATPTNGFAGTVALTCAVVGPTGATDVPTCGLAPASVILSTAAAASALTVTTQTATTPGDYTVTVTGTSGSTVTTESFVLTVVLGGSGGGFTLTATTPITVASQGASATSTVTVTPTITPNGVFNGSVALACAVTSSPSGATELPTCVVTPASVTISGTTAATATLSVNTTSQTTGRLKMLFPLGGGGATFAALFLLVGTLGRRGQLSLKAVRSMRLLSAAALFALIAAAVTGCGSGTHTTGGGGGTPTGGTTTGAYTVTVTATTATGTAVTTTVAVTVD